MANAASMTAVAPPPGMPSASSVAMEPASEELLADSEATTPSGLPRPKEAGSADFLRVCIQDSRLAIEEPTPGMAPTNTPIRLPRRITRR